MTYYHIFKKRKTIVPTPRTKKVVSLADKERKIHNHRLVGTEHILIGMLREGDGVAARVLHTLNVDLEAARREMLKIHPAETSTNEFVIIGAATEQSSEELFASAEKILGSPPRPLRIPRRVFAALCAVNDLIVSDETREDWFIAVLTHLRKQKKNQPS